MATGILTVHWLSFYNAILNNLKIKKKNQLYSWVDQIHCPINCRLQNGDKDHTIIPRAFPAISNWKFLGLASFLVSKNII